MSLDGSLDLEMCAYHEMMYGKPFVECGRCNPNVPFETIKPK